jgi:hypothetical protein
MYKIIYHNLLLHQLITIWQIRRWFKQINIYLIIYFTHNFEFNCHMLFWAFIYYNIKTLKKKDENPILIIYVNMYLI